MVSNANFLLILTAIFLAAPLRAEPDPYTNRTQVTVHDKGYYTDLIQQNRKANPGSGAKWEVETAKQPDYRAQLAPDDSSNPNGGRVDRAEKFTDASRLAADGYNEAASAATDLVIKQIQAGLNQVTNTGPPTAQQLADGAIYQDGIDKFTKNSDAMAVARDMNARGRALLKRDPVEPVSGPSVAGSPSLTKNAVSRMSEDTKKALRDKGVDPEQLVERLLSGSIDPRDPTALYRELGGKMPVPDIILDEAQEITARKLAEGLDLERVIRGEETGSYDPFADPRRGAMSGDRENFRATHPELGGIPFVLYSRAGFRRPGLKENGEGEGYWVKTKDGRRTFVKRSPKGRLTAMDFYRLQNNGVTAPRHGTNIFHIAHREYRNYAKWRTLDGGAVATNP